MRQHGSRATLLLWLLLAAGAQAAHFVDGDLPRQGDLGFRTDSRDGGLFVTHLVADSAAASAGLRDADRITAIDGQAVDRPYEGDATLVAIKGGQRVALDVIATAAGTNPRPRRVSFVPPSRAYEDVPGLDSYYGVVRTRDGSRLRTIVTRPAAAPGVRLPVIFFTQWVSCDSLELTRGGLSREILKALAQRSGAALVRVERAGTGDSLGPACHRLDYDTEVEHYREALDATLTRYDWLDPSRVVVYGSSLGATVAPLVAQGHRLAGVIVQGGGALTYLERMIHFDRQQLERTGVPAAEIDGRMRRQAQFHVEYLLKARNPNDIARDGPDMAAARAAIRGLGDGEHYGRPYAWHQQAAQRDFVAAWDRIDAPVLVLYGEFDQFETRHGHELIAQTVNHRHPGAATFLEIAHMDHEGELYDTVEDAYAWRNSLSGPPETAQRVQTGPMLRWLKDVVGFPVRP